MRLQLPGYATSTGRSIVDGVGRQVTNLMSTHVLRPFLVLSDWSKRTTRMILALQSDVYYSQESRRLEVSQDLTLKFSACNNNGRREILESVQTGRGIVGERHHGGGLVDPHRPRVARIESTDVVVADVDG